MGEIGNQRHVEDGFGTRSLASLRSSTGSAVFKDHRSSIRFLQQKFLFYF
ncbi:unnamed protein product [Onchocerca flexuosa]|uniref:Uncharacterized protein n=1 Tax=Onchocerca flexuosa TaxID=387005 RepID=A0A183HBJ5_9BILA|nr:unnamed protein product [Onchocerca flexuosa]